MPAVKLHFVSLTPTQEKAISYILPLAHVCSRLFLHIWVLDKQPTTRKPHHATENICNSPNLGFSPLSTDTPPTVQHSSRTRGAHEAPRAHSRSQPAPAFRLPEDTVRFRRKCAHTGQKQHTDKMILSPQDKVGHERLQRQEPCSAHFNASCEGPGSTTLSMVSM